VALEGHAQEPLPRAASGRKGLIDDSV
jgi:hypothetical protein